MRLYNRRRSWRVSSKTAEFSWGCRAFGTCDSLTMRVFDVTFMNYCSHKSMQSCSFIFLLLALILQASREVLYNIFQAFMSLLVRVHPSFAVYVAVPPSFAGTVPYTCCAISLIRILLEQPLPPYHLFYFNLTFLLLFSFHFNRCYIHRKSISQQPSFIRCSAASCYITGSPSSSSSSSSVFRVFKHLKNSNEINERCLWLKGWRSVTEDHVI